MSDRSDPAIPANAEDASRRLLGSAGRAQSAGDWTGAARLHRRAEALSPHLAAAIFGGAVADLQAGRVAESLAAFRRAAVLLPGHAGLRHNVGVCQRRLGRRAEAGRSLRRAVILDPAATGALRALAHTALDLDEPDLGVACARRAVLLHQSSDTLVDLGEAARRAGRLAEAETALDRALALDPACASGRTTLANVMMDGGREAAAIDLYRAIAQDQPQSRIAWSNLGVALARAGDWWSARDAYRRYVRLTRGRPVGEADHDPFPEFPANPTADPNRQVSWHRLAHDRAQLEWLLDNGLLPSDYRAEAEAYRRILDDLDPVQRRAVTFELPETALQTIRRVHDRLVHVAPTGYRAARDDRRDVLNASVDWAAAEAAYLDGTPRATVIDSLLTREALEALRRYCLGSTIWFHLKGAGYLGAYFRDGFHDPLLLRIAEELQARMPRVLGGQPLRMIWAYSYEQTMVGINPHADFARVNVNFWITPDEANLDPESGGLVVYRKPAPADWGFEEYNAAPADAVFEFLGDAAKDPLRVPHRCNRALLFDSRLFHETDRMRFAPGFTNRRINITMLFGDGG